MSESTDVSPRRGLLSGIGPAIITAAVVLGPGSILSSSKIGSVYGYQMTWVLALAVLLMIGMSALGVRLGVTLEGTLCEELARRGGRPLAAVTGVTLFLIAACFQFGNNLGVLAAIEPFEIFDPAEPSGRWLPLVIIVNLNILIIVALYGFRALYRPVENLMKILVGLMTIGFASNLIMARPDLWQILKGLIPSFPKGSAETLLPRWEPAVVQNGVEVIQGEVVDNLLPVVAMFATTFVVAAAFYQSYLVREKGWKHSDLRKGMIDTFLGIGMLGLITLMIMSTAAAVLHGNPDVTQLNTAADVARQLEPAFGTFAKVLFCMGIFAGAFSSFLVNSMIGGTMLSDGLGLGGHIDGRWPKLFTVLALMIGMNVAIYIHTTGQRPVNLIIFAQALTILGVPLLAGVMLWLATRSDLQGERKIPMWMKVAGGTGLAIAIILAFRTAVRIALELGNR